MAFPLAAFSLYEAFVLARSGVSEGMFLLSGRGCFCFYRFFFVHEG